MFTTKTGMTAVTTVIGEPAKRTNLSVWEGLKNSKLAAPVSRHLMDAGVIPVPNPTGAPRP